MKQPIRTVAYALLIFFSVCLLASCAYPVEEEYHDFLLDLDLVNRFEICIDRVERSKASLYIQNELEVLQDEIRAWEGGSKNIQQTNQQLIDCSETLLAAMHFQATEDLNAAETEIERAKILFEEAKHHIRENNQAITNAG